MQILKYLLDSGPATDYTVEFMNVMEDHMIFLRNHPDNKTLTPSGNHIEKYRGDLFGLLLANKVSPYLHWPTMRMNGMTNPNQYDENFTSLIIPSDAAVTRIRNMFNTQSKIKM